ncbi:anaerobic ribonucleoside-triphosphate reductase activating protein [Catenuloplanes nepalensis]|uniref:Anaerobic ribonucleoside-triphosphate reductase activating protein n=1 Tax=Catenuloplanes nepalensis TaxID=587533 RepID=A0ABT9MNY5_9ACTN|nr:4Fe-4S single cluster domain-containing protein [Catenuloplanes nepalensis]MDP9793134.1 anaerobic ribonucleoside-triphosphate reductase activating protein [Catenuloplanes nepalensis]
MTILTISRVAARTSVLGPGVRAVIWVHGCPLRCAGCIAPEDLPFDGGDRRAIDELAAWLTGLPADVTGVTFSGGEPMAQAAELAELTALIRRERDWSVMSYTGFTLGHLRRHGTPGQHALLAALDVLVDGPYLAARHADLRWRASDNQRVHLLTDRHPAPARDTSAGIEVHAGTSDVMWIGVPPVPGFRDHFAQAMRDRGVLLDGAPEPTNAEETDDVG